MAAPVQSETSECAAAAATLPAPPTGFCGVDATLLAPECAESAKSFTCVVCIKVPLPGDARVCHYCEAAVFCQTCAASLSECAVCREKFEANLPRPLQGLALNVMSALRAHCPQRCDDAAFLTLDALAVHMETVCPQRMRACGWPDCSAVVPACELGVHRTGCEFVSVRCEKGCGLRVARRFAASHNCVASLVSSLSRAKVDIAHLKRDFRPAEFLFIAGENRRLSTLVGAMSTEATIANFAAEFARLKSGMCVAPIEVANVSGWKIRLSVYPNGYHSKNSDFISVYAFFLEKPHDWPGPSAFKGDLKFTLVHSTDEVKNFAMELSWSNTPTWRQHCAANRKYPWRTGYGFPEWIKHSDFFAPPHSRKRERTGEPLAPTSDFIFPDGSLHVRICLKPISFV